MEFHREITLIELAPSTHVFVKSICLVDIYDICLQGLMNSSKDIKETKRFGWMYGQRETVYPPQTHFAGGYKLTC